MQKNELKLLEVLKVATFASEHIPHFDAAQSKVMELLAGLNESQLGS